MHTDLYVTCTLLEFHSVSSIIICTPKPEDQKRDSTPRSPDPTCPYIPPCSEADQLQGNIATLKTTQEINEAQLCI